MLCLNLRFHSISFDQNAVCPNGSINLSIFTFPDMQKQTLTIDTKDMYNSEKLFKIKYNDNTDNIIICFVKKSFFFKEEIIATASIRSKDIDENTAGYMKIDLYEPNPHLGEITNKIQKERKIVGTMKANFALKEIFTVDNYGFNYDKLEQLTLRKKFNSKYDRKKNNEQYVFN